MTPKFDLTSLVESDIDAIVDYLIAQSIPAARRFLDAVYDEFKRLAQNPYLGGVYETSNSALQGLRVWPIPSFKNHLIFYLPTENSVQIVRVIHGARDYSSLF